MKLVTFALAALMLGTAPVGAMPAGQRSDRINTGGVYYPGCNAVRALGKAPLYRGQPGYRVEMDGDGDGIACEPYVGGGSDYNQGDRGRRRRRSR